MDVDELMFLLVACLSAYACALLLTARPRAGRRAAQPLERDLLGRLPLVRKMRERERREAVRSACVSQMPELLDILTLGLSAGLSFDMALSLYCARFSTELGDAFGEALLSWRMGLGTRAEVLGELAKDLGSPAVERFASTVAEALEFGSPLSSALERQAESMRDEQRALVEEQIEKVPVKMLVPLGTLIVPAMLLAVLGPLIAAATLIS